MHSAISHYAFLINLQEGGQIMYGGYGKNQIKFLEIANKVDDFIFIFGSK
jgi:hypothetical protein